jgi:hypothetical protein
MSQYKFIHTATDVYGNTQNKIIYITNEIQLNYIVDAFRDFIKGCGFSMDGMDIQLVNIDKEES